MKSITLIILSIIQLTIFGCWSNSAKPKTNALSHADSLQLKNKPRPVIVDSFERFVYQTMAETHIPGAAVAIVIDNKVQLLKGYGVKTFGFSDSVDVHTVFRIASVSKGFASMLAGILVEEKYINWDDKIRKYLPKFRLKDTFNTNHLTIRHVLSHTSGLPLHTYTNLIEDKIPYADLRDRLYMVGSTGRVGTVYAYQNVVYSLISDVAEASTKKTYEQLLTDKIFKPLDMTDASASYKALTANKNVAEPHLRNSRTYFKVTKNTPTYYAVLPAAGVNASISDMSKWLLALLGNDSTVISMGTLKEIYKPEIVTPRRNKYQFFHWSHLKEAHYGMGWRVINYGGHTLIYHGGHINGYRSEVAFLPDKKVGIVILTNAAGKLANNAVEVFFNHYFGYENPHETVVEQKNADVDPHSPEVP